ncbi:MAG: 3-hydroxyanthranilate 3,4-dioxygenase [Chloracidobacterium sp. CP2_5A]|nr:MAG: 3-hydroxyanthranilate 3,4-dioxygenase [Chloracidobacterium sp. CP2_5A]
MLTAINFRQWIEDHRHLLRPPVGNAQVWKDREFMVTVVGGPNQRKDYHIDPGEEFFYQLEGDMTLRLIENGQFRDLPIREGEIFLLPPLVPHSPQRGPNTLGLVIERIRRPDEQDRFEWYCDRCGNRLHEVALRVTDITTQLKPLFDAFWADERARVCAVCGHQLQP